MEKGKGEFRSKIWFIEKAGEIFEVRPGSQKKAREIFEMRHTSYKITVDFFKADFRITFKNSVFLAAAYLLVIPAIRGISNLDAARTAHCLEQSVALIGALILIPITKGEMGNGVKEIIYTKAWPYRKSIGLRFLCGCSMVAALVTAFAFVMRRGQCTFPFWKYVWGAVFYAVFLGLLGLVCSQIGSHVLAGYLSALGYWSLCRLQIIEEGSAAYLFPVVNGSFETGRMAVLLSADLILAGAVWRLIREGN